MGSVESGLYVVSGNFIIGTAILITLLTDSVAEILAPTPITFIINDIVLFSPMGLLLILSVFILVNNYSAKKSYPAMENLQPKNEVDYLFRSRYLSFINPRKYPLRFSILFSLSFSLFLATIEVIGEGPAPSYGQTALVFVLLTTIGTVGFFVILMLTGRYLGILGKRTKITT